ncbi:hypothetical protein AAF712_004826 [Marasmius tenuissimus]|uniref:Uncharacterized protein n=1 Tax=Marasmius tenuissimus TaxID=585030 RepID=A0ABR3A2E7_9AGAR
MNLCPNQLPIQLRIQLLNPLPNQLHMQTNPLKKSWVLKRPGLIQCTLVAEIPGSGPPFWLLAPNAKVSQAPSEVYILTVIDMSPEADYSNIKSGLLLNIELDVVLAGQAAPIERIDYRDVVELKTFQHSNVWRLMDHTHQVWYLCPDLPHPAVDPASFLSRFNRLPVDIPRTPRPCTPTPPPSFDPWNPLGKLAPTERDHWIFHPKLVGLRIKVSITGGPHASGEKPVHVKPVSKVRGVVVKYSSGQGLTAVTHTILHTFIGRSKDPIKPSTENSLMVITSGNIEHIGKLVCRIHTFYFNKKKEENHWIVAGVVERSAGGEKLTDELLDLHPGMHVVRVKESAEQQAAGNKYMDQPRKEAREDWSHCVEVRRVEVQPFATET